MRRDLNSRGSAVILVVWMLGILGMIAAFLIYRSEAEWAGTVSMERRMAVRRLASEILQERLELLIGDDDEVDTVNEDWYGGTGVSQFDKDGYQITLIIEDEGSKPNINILKNQELELLTSDDSLNFAPLLDWIDTDDELRDDGAEAAYYQSLNPGYKPRNGFLSSLHEILAVKNGEQLYPVIAPYCTVYGKYNPNILTKAQFENLLLSYGFQESMAERITEDFNTYRVNERFYTVDDFLKLGSVTIQTRDQLEPLFEFQGHCNINLVNETGLRVILIKAGYDEKLAEQFLELRQENPFTSIDEIQAILKNKNKNKALKGEDYFSVTSSIFRFQIWLIKGKSRFYLESIQERKKGDAIAVKWQMQPLTWNFLINDDVPELPDFKSAEEEEEEEDHE